MKRPDMMVLPAPASSASRNRKRELLQHVLVDRNPLVRQRVDLRDLGGEGRVEHVAEAQPLALGEDADHIRRPREVGHRRPNRLGLGFGSCGESSSSNFRICDQASGDGFVCPFSQRFTVTKETPSRAANSVCVSPMPAAQLLERSRIVSGDSAGR